MGIWLSIVAWQPHAISPVLPPCPPPPSLPIPSLSRALSPFKALTVQHSSHTPSFSTSLSHHPLCISFHYTFPTLISPGSGTDAPADGTGKEKKRMVRTGNIVWSGGTHCNRGGKSQCGEDRATEPSSNDILIQLTALLLF